MKLYNILYISLALMILVLPTISAITFPQPPYSYYKLNEGSGTIGADQGMHVNITSLNVSHWTTKGKILGGYNATTEQAFILSNLSYAENITFTFWINRTGDVGDQGSILFGTGNSGTDQGRNFYVSMDHTGGNANLLTLNTYTSGSASIVATNPLNLGSWYFVTIVIARNNLSIYVNGSTEASAAIDTPVHFSNNNLNLFKIPSGSAINNITIDEIGIWNRALNPDEIAFLYNNGNGISYPFIKENSQSFNNNTFVGSNEQFIINFTYDNSFYPSITGILTYNGTNFTGIQAGTSNNILFIRNVTIPSINVPQQNNTFYWTLLLTNANGTTYFRSQDFNQSVRQISVDDCSTNTVRIYNFTLYDEDTLIKINSTFNTTIEVNLQLTSINGSVISTYSNNYSNINPALVCISTNALNQTTYYADLIVRYDADSYVSEFYNEQMTPLSSLTTLRNISLYDLLTTRAQEFKMIFKGADLLPLQNYLVQLNRFYIDDGVYRTVEIGRTDSSGVTLGHFVLSEVYYRLTLTKNGQIVFIYPDFQASCDNIATGDCVITRYIFTDAPTLTNFTTIGGIRFTPLLYNETTREVTTSFTVIDGSSQLLILNATDTQGNQLVATSLTSSTGNLLITIPPLRLGNGLNNMTVIITLQNGNKILSFGTVNLQEKPEDLYGGGRVLLTVGIVLCLVGMALSSGGVMIVMMVLGLLLSSSLGLISIYGSDNVSIAGFGGALLGLIAFVVLYMVIKSNRTTQ